MGERHRILVVDDDVTSRTSTASELEAEGFELAVAGDARAALELYDTFAPQLVLLDSVLAELDGFEICARLRRLDVPVVMMTAPGDAASIEKAYAAGAGDFVTKPIDYFGLRHRLRYTLRTLAERRAADERIRRLAYVDPVTELPNRAFLVRHLGQVLEQSRRQKRRGAVLALDLDSFKRVNDTLGHGAGDALLCAVAERVSQCVRGADFVSRAETPVGALNSVARFGGDEFVVLLTDLRHVDDAGRVAQRILSRVAEPFTLLGQEVFVTSSIGIALFPGNADDPEVLLRAADAALYQAKELGRNGFAFWSESISAKARERLALETELRHALDRRELELHYQPIVDSSGGHVCGAEALLRWNRPGRGLIAPLDFIPLAEDTGLIVSIGRWVMRTACQQARRWQQRVPGFSISINISARQFKDRELVSMVREALGVSGLPPNLLELEITEGTLMHDVRRASSVLSELRGIGVRVAIDDFGTGYSSLAYLRCLPLDTLKIDRSFVREVTSNQDCAAIATAIIALSRSLRLEAVAEGVETPQQLEFLAGRQCPKVQGFMFSPPLPVPEFERWLCAGGESGVVRRGSRSARPARRHG